MPPKKKKTLDSNMKKEMADEKENKKSNLRIKKNTKDSSKEHFDKEEAQQKEFSMSSSKVELKPLGFWSKKLLDLEDNETKKKVALYEFSGTDESESSYRAKKKIKPKPRLQKKKQPSAFNKKISGKIKKSEEENKKTKKQTSNSEQILFSQDREKLNPKDGNLIFPTGSNFAITSTPAANKNNFIGASNFLFLSPIIKEEVERNVTKNSSVKLEDVDEGSPSVHVNPETPKLETKLKRISCRRVLRSGKMLTS